MDTVESHSLNFRNLFIHISIVKPTRYTISHILFYFILFYFGKTLYMFRSPSVHHQESKTVHTASYHTGSVCTVLDFWWWTERPSETCRVFFQNKIKLEILSIWLVLLQKYITRHGPTYVKKNNYPYRAVLRSEYDSKNTKLMSFKKSQFYVSHISVLAVRYPKIFSVLRRQINGLAVYIRH